jgi:hypothetical protein
VRAPAHSTPSSCRPHLPAPVSSLPTRSPTTWHRRLGHPGAATLHHLAQTSSISCNSKADGNHLCHACQLGRHVRLPFSSSPSRASLNFDLIHCDLWTSPVPSVSGFKYYLVILDHCSHFVWTFPLRLKSDTFSPSPISLPMFTLNSGAQSNPCNVIMVANLLTPPLVLLSCQRCLTTHVLPLHLPTKWQSRAHPSHPQQHH